MSSDLTLLRTQLLAGLPAPAAGAAPAALAAQGPDGDWPDIDYQDRTPSGWRPRLHLERARDLAVQGLRTSDERLLAAAHAGLSAWLRRDPICPNWWHNQIGAPRLLGEIILVLQPRPPSALLASARPLLARADASGMWFPEGVHPQPWTGANRLWISANRLLAGAIFGDEALIRESVAAAMTEVRVSASTEEGIQVDGSFHQHGPLLYNGGYGASYLHECIFFLAATHGTRWQPDLKHHRLLADFLLDGTRWMLRGDDIDGGSRDREITRPWVSIKSYARPASFLATAGLHRSAELRDLAEALARGEAPGALAGNRMFHRSDFMVQQAPGHRVSVRMHSLRTLRAECCNAEGLLSHHVADGMTTLHRTGTEYREIYPVWDWSRLPGTTCARPLREEPWETVRAFGRSPSVGGVSDGRFGVCTQQLHADHLLARKSWFFGPDAVVCLGAGIRGFFPAAVVTTLDQSHLQGAVSWDGAPEPLAPGRHALRGARWLRHGDWGFVFHRPANVSVEIGPREGAWSRIGAGPAAPVVRDVFLAGLDHGEAPENADYAYTILPDAAPARLNTAAEYPPGRILQNTPLVQAVWFERAGLLQALFFAAGEITWEENRRLRVDRECAVQLSREPSGAWTIHLADIRQGGGTIHLELHDPSLPAPLSHAVACPAGDNAGASVRVA